MSTKHVVFHGDHNTYFTLWLPADVRNKLRQAVCCGYYPGYWSMCQHHCRSDWRLFEWTGQSALKQRWYVV